MINDKINVYDFDGTIYDGDSTVDFYFYCLKRNKGIILDIPKFIIAVINYKLHRIDKTSMKQEFYSFLKRMDIKDSYLEEFWDTHKKKIKQWYLDKKSDTDIIISASPEFLLQPMKEYLGVNKLIASKVDIKNGVCYSKNCRGKEKVTRLREEVGKVQIQAFYSDNRSDKYLAEIAEKAYFVSGNSISDW